MRDEPTAQPSNIDHDRFEYKTIQLNRLDWRDFLDHPNPIACALMTKMKIAQTERPLVKAMCLKMLAGQPLTAREIEIISRFIDTYLRLDRREEQEFQHHVEQFAPKEKETAMEMMTSWEERGFERGEGRMVLRQLTRKFGSVPELLEGRIRSLKSAQLEALGEELLDFQQLADVEKWLSESH